jgi:hypothetical protein
MDGNPGAGVVFESGAMLRRVACSVAMLGLSLGCNGSGPSPGPDGGNRGTDAGADSGLPDAGADSGTDAGVDAGSDAGSDAGAIVAPADQWTWVDFPASRCASGSATGMAINPHAGATELFVYFEGGGACYDGLTCWGPAPKAANLEGYDAGTFAAAEQRLYPLLDRATSGNPFGAMNMLFIPYCTGDMHSGYASAALPLPDGGTKQTYFWGGADMDLFLARVVPTLPQTTRVWSTGTSAGGYGSFLNFDRLQRAFGVPVDVLDDSGPPLVRDGGTNNGGLFTAWGYTAPAGCNGCDSLAKVLAYDLQTQTTFTPPGRYGFLSFTQDTVISVDFGYTLAEYPGLMRAFSAGLPASPAAATYLVSGEQSHVVQSDPKLLGDYLPWVTQMVNGDAGWSDVCLVLDGGC